jgi:hypothetical protein
MKFEEEEIANGKSREEQARTSLVFVTLPRARNIAARSVGMLGAKKSRSHANVTTQAAL